MEEYKITLIRNIIERQMGYVFIYKDGSNCYPQGFFPTTIIKLAEIHIKTLYPSKNVYPFISPNSLGLEHHNFIIHEKRLREYYKSITDT